MKRYQLSRLSRGKARSRAPIISGSEEIAERDRDRGHQEEPHHDHAVQREQPVVGLGRLQHALRGRSGCSRINAAATPPMKKKKVIDAEIEHRDPLVVGASAASCGC